MKRLRLIGNRFRKDDLGATVVEYGIIAGGTLIMITMMLGTIVSELEATFDAVAVVLQQK